MSGFAASPDNDSPVATIDMFAQYIENPITISVNAPFLLSDDNETWSTSITVSPDEETIFVKMGACAVGQYTSLDGLPAGPAIQISDRSFVAVWTNIDPVGTIYKLYVYQGGILLDDYPVNVRAEAEKDLVEELMPSTDYTYVVESPTLRSNEVAVRTADPIPFIEMSSSAELDEISATPEEPSDAIIINIDCENIFEDITISVSEPFQVM